jgi:hypothetical protein
MVRDASKIFKICATCVQWEGERKLVPGGYVRYESDLPGRCLGEEHKGREMFPVFTCMGWQLWSPLNKM